MFLHAGASIHGHEFSGPRPSQQQPRRLPILRSALRNPTTEPPSRAPAPAPARAPSPVSRPTSSNKLPRPLSYHEYAPTTPRTTRPRPTSDYMPRRELSVRFREPETDDDVPPSEAPASEDEGSVACSDLSDLSDSSTTIKKRRRRKRAPRKSTQYLLAHPASRPFSKQRRLQTRPRLILQLQELTDRRPVPAFDVLPSSLVASSIIPRLANRCPRVFQSKSALGLNDLLIVRSEDYGAPHIPDLVEPEDSLEQRETVAIISPLSQTGDDAAEITMEDGSTWESSLMANGSYEFIGVDERGRISTARWIKKAITTPQPTTARVLAGTSTPPPSPSPPEYKWTFSLIHPDTRRHPIMGSLVSNTLEVFETYNTMSTSSGRYPPTRSATISSSVSSDWVAPTPADIVGRLTKAVPQDIKLLMTVTAIWITLRQEGWPANARLPPATLQKRTYSGFTQAKLSNSSPRGSPVPSNGVVLWPGQALPSPAPSISEPFTGESAGRRRSLSSSVGFVKRMVAPRASEDGGRPTLDSVSFHQPPAVSTPPPASRPPSRRLSVSMRQIATKIFRRRSISQAQQGDAFSYTLE